ncbi:MAG: cytochrome c biogenesis protein CcdA [Candidatus Acidiferrales bacterium]
MLILLTMFAAGLLHGLGPDHLAAIAALVSKNATGHNARRRLAWLGVRFGLGHVTTLLLLAGVVWSLGRNIPDGWQRGLEQAGAVVLIFLGGWLLAEVFRRRVVAHSHAHTHEHTHGALEHDHWHLHVGAKEHAAHRHPHLAMVVGGLMGFSGARALLLAVPVVLAQSAFDAAGRILAFGLGIVVSMALAGWLAHALFARLARTPAYARLLVSATGVLSAALGFYWLARFSAG